MYWANGNNKVETVVWLYGNSICALIILCFTILTFPKGTTVPIADHIRGWKNSYICHNFDSKNITCMLTVKITWIIIAWKKRCLSEGVTSEIYTVSYNAFLLHIWNSSIRELYFSFEVLLSLNAGLSWWTFLCWTWSDLFCCLSWAGWYD